MRILAAALIVGCAGCASPDRPVFEFSDEGDDTVTPPVILLHLPVDSVVQIGDTLEVFLRVFDRTGIVTVTAAVSGVLNFGFPTMSPNDTLFEAQFPIPTASAPPGLLDFSVTALDRLGNFSSGLRRFTLQ